MLLPNISLPRTGRGIVEIGPGNLLRSFRANGAGRVWRDCSTFRACLGQGG
jgi:hypothetical protein